MADAAIAAKKRCVGNLAEFALASAAYEGSVRLWERAERIDERRQRLLGEGR